MAQSAKPPAKSQHAGKTRKPPVIDHEPQRKTTPEAEPIATPNASEKKQEKIMSDSAQDETTTATAKTAAGGGAKQASNPSTSSVSGQQSPHDKKSTGGHLFSGVAGGVVALLLGAGLQWSGVIPSFSNDKSFQEKLDQVSGELNGLKSQVSSNDMAQSSQLLPADRKALDDTAEIAAAARQQVGEMATELANIRQAIGALENAVNSIGAEAGNPEALNALMQKFDALDQRMTTIGNLPQKTGEALALAAANTETIKALSQQIETLKTQLASPVQGKEIAVIMAANALKNAVDRGGSYVNELKTLQAVAPEGMLLDGLQKSAATGLANQAMLSTEFARVADAIAATENLAPADAGFGEQLWAGAKGLVSSRPVGNVEGANPAAIAARMEVAIKAGDYGQALSEWQNLPQNAKDVSQDFVQKLRVKQDADALLAQVIAMAMQAPAPQGGN